MHEHRRLGFAVRISIEEVHPLAGLKRHEPAAAARQECTFPHELARRRTEVIHLKVRRIHLDRDRLTVADVIDAALDRLVGHLVAIRPAGLGLAERTAGEQDDRGGSQEPV